MKYLAILGRQPEFGLAELECQLGPNLIQQFGQAAVLGQEIEIAHFGGVQKVGKIIHRGIFDLDSIPLEALPLRGGKTSFGVSLYGKFSPKVASYLGLNLKKKLREKGSVRMMYPSKGTVLSAAQLKFNHIPQKGFDLMIIRHGLEMIAALTESYQDIDWYAKRDYGRPARSAKVGMLPPKLAQVMVNTTAAGTIYDPFCGTGVVLQEGLLLGRAVYGSDISPEMVRASRTNLDWLQNQTKGAFASREVTQADATTLQLPTEPLAIVSEGFLGPNQTSRPDQAAYHKLKTETEALYQKALLNWASQLASGTDVTVTAPCWNTLDGWRGLSILDRLSDLGYTLRVLKQVDTRRLVYHRPDQIVGRQLLLLRKT